METLAYLHLALAYETPEDIGLCEGLDWRKFSSQAWMYLLPVMVTLSVVGMASQTLAKTLRVGMTDPEVSVLQERLQELNYFNGPITSFFGSLTEAAVKEFQRDYQLSPDGIYGSNTEAALEQALGRVGRRTSSQPFNSGRSRTTVQAGASGRILQLGSSGSDVRLLQERLRQEGFYFGPIYEFFDSETEQAVRQFQQARRLRVDGIVGRETLAALQRSDMGILMGRPQAPLRAESRTLNVKQLQERLKAVGFYTGPIDGNYDSRTRQAVRQFQRANNLAATGIADRKTLAALMAYRYVVVVPIQNDNTLRDVRAVQGFANARLDNAGQGRYVNAGLFTTRASAESRSHLLRSRGLDARVAYR